MDTEQLPDNIIPFSRAKAGGRLFDQQMVPAGTTIEDLRITDFEEQEGIARVFVKDQYGDDVFRVSRDESGDISAKMISDLPVNALFDKVEDFFRALNTGKDAHRMPIEHPNPQTITLTSPFGDVAVNLYPDIFDGTAVEMNISNIKLVGRDLSRFEVCNFFATINEGGKNGTNLPMEIIEATFDKMFEQQGQFSEGQVS